MHKDRLTSLGISAKVRSAMLLILLAAAWDLAWKGSSLWRAARNESKPWFTALLITNTLGVLDAMYLFGVDRPRRRRKLVEHDNLAATGEPKQLRHTQET
jgi:hypothetical protein